MDLAIMIEGQDGLNWPRWQRLARAAESLGYAGLFRSDHFTNARPPDKDSLELWVSLTWLAGHTSRIEFGPLVSPFSFRNPAFTARMAAAVDDLAGGRLILGLGAGWQEREHEKFGFPLLDIPERFARFEEGLQVVRALLHSDAPVDFDGAYYELNEAVLLPRPARPGGPPILIGGNGPRRTLPLAARYADEWNGVYLAARDIAVRNERLDELLVNQRRAPGDVRRSLMTLCIYGDDAEAEVERRASAANMTVEQLLARGVLTGPAGRLIDQLGALAEAGVQRVMLQWLDQDDIDGLAAIAADVLPHFA